MDNDTLDEKPNTKRQAKFKKRFVPTPVDKEKRAYKISFKKRKAVGQLSLAMEN